MQEIKQDVGGSILERKRVRGDDDDDDDTGDLEV